MTALWEGLVAAALLGTARRAPDLPPVGGRLGRTLGAVDRGDPEIALLGAAALLAPYRRAGWLPAADAAPPPAPCPTEDAPVCSARAAQLLDLLLAGSHRAALPEWLARAAAGRQRLPPERLVAVLEAATADDGLRPQARAALGVRGRWLADLNPRWAWAVADAADPERTWATGEREQRLLLLRALRQREPDRARNLLAGTWQQEPAADRAAFLATFEAGLGPADEPLLEAALDDRGAQVRAAAARLLSALPASALAQRMAQRARGVLRRRGGLRARLDAAPPAQVDDGAVRDGIARRAPAGKGERAWWLEQLVAAAPLSVWPQELGAAPGTLVGWAQAGDWGGVLLASWAEAAVRQRDATWASALLGHRPDARLLAVLPPEQGQAAVAERLAAGLAGEHDALRLLQALPGPWGARLTAAFLRALRPVVRAPLDAGGWQLARLLPGFGARADPGTVAAGGGLGEPHDDWRAALAGFLDLVTVRAEIHQELP